MVLKIQSANKEENMTKYNQLPQAEHMYVYEKKSLAEIGAQLGLSRRILFYWKKKYNWDKKRFEMDYEKENFSKELLEFARKIMNKISNDIDNNQKTPPPEIYSLINILKNIPFVNQYANSIKTDKKPKQKEFLSEENLKFIEREFFGML